MPETPPTAAAADSPSYSQGTEHLAHLKKMSTTAGVGAQEYSAINPLAVIGLLLGLLSVLAFFDPVLLLVPAAGAVCAVLAWWQIRQSNGTQTGKLIAIGGMALCVLVGGGVAVRDAMAAAGRRADRQAIIQTVDDFGRLITERKFDQAHAMTSPAFQQRIDRARFTEAWRMVSDSAQTGGVQSFTSNKTVEFSDEGRLGAGTGFTLAIVVFKNPELVPQRWTIPLSQTGTGWQIDDLPDMFPAEKPGKGG